MTEVAPLAVYTPNANKDKPPAAAKVLSQSVTNASKPVPITEPAVLETNNIIYILAYLAELVKKMIMIKNLNIEAEKTKKQFLFTYYNFSIFFYRILTFDLK